MIKRISRCIRAYFGETKNTAFTSKKKPLKKAATFCMKNCQKRY